MKELYRAYYSNGDSNLIAIITIVIIIFKNIKNESITVRVGLFVKT